MPPLPRRGRPPRPETVEERQALWYMCLGPGAALALTESSLALVQLVTELRVSGGPAPRGERWASGSRGGLWLQGSQWLVVQRRVHTGSCEQRPQRLGTEGSGGRARPAGQ